jgi:hypothetical protein
MQLKIILSVAIGGWVAAVLLVVSLCRAAKRSDEAMERAVAEAMERAVAEAIAAGRSPEIAHAPPLERPLRSLGLEHAAALLGVSGDTLLAWHARYGFPTSSPAEPHYSQSEVLALRDSLEDGLSIASAVSRARQRTKRRRAITASRSSSQ